MNEITNGSLWRHFGGRVFRVVCLSNLKATNPENVKTVTYECAKGIYWSLPISVFLDRFIKVEELND